MSYEKIENTYNPAFNDLDWGAFFDLPCPTLPPLPPLPPLAPFDLPALKKYEFKLFLPFD